MALKRPGLRNQTAPGIHSAKVARGNASSGRERIARIMVGMLKRYFQIKKETNKNMSIICAYNNKQKLETILVKSLEQQTASFELLTIDNTAGEFPSAPQILNETARQAKHDYLMFVHQDVALDSKDWLASALGLLETLPRLGAAGVAGRSRFRFAASVSQGATPHFLGPRRLKSPVQVQTLDGCLMIVPKVVFEKIQFNESTVDGWYFYVLDYCLTLKRLGYKNYVLPNPVFHESVGPSDPSLYQGTLDRIIAAHRDHITKIYSTMGEWKT